MCKRYKSLQQDCIGEDVRQALELFDCQLKTHFQPDQKPVQKPVRTVAIYRPDPETTGAPGGWSIEFMESTKAAKMGVFSWRVPFYHPKTVALNRKTMENPLVLGYPLSH